MAEPPRSSLRKWTMAWMPNREARDNGPRRLDRGVAVRALRSALRDGIAAVGASEVRRRRGRTAGDPRRRRRGGRRPGDRRQQPAALDDRFSLLDRPLHVAYGFRHLLQPFADSGGHRPVTVGEFDRSDLKVTATNLGDENQRSSRASPNTHLPSRPRYP